jgi:hypothetical protein
MTKLDIEHIKSEAKKHLEKIWELTAQRPSPFENISKDEAIEKIRETRKKLWEKKFVARS